jgi:hypothetical protein
LEGVFRLEELSYAGRNLVADLSNDIGGLTSGIRQRPVLAPDARHHRTLFPAPHRHEKVSCCGKFWSEPCRPSVRHVKTHFLHCDYDRGMDALGWGGSG